MTASFLLGLLIGAGAFAILLLPRLRAAHERQLALVTGNREQLAEQMKAISSDALRQATEQLEKLGTAQREADRATAAGELGKRTEEIKRSLDPIAQNLKRVSDEVARLEQDRRTTHGQTRQMFESMSAEVGRLRDQTGTLVVGAQAPAGPRRMGRDAAAQLRGGREHDRARRLRLPGERDRLRRQPAAPRSRRAPARRARRGGGREGADGRVPPRARDDGRGRAAGAPAAARPPDAPAHRRAGVEELSRAVRVVARVRGDVHPERGRVLRRARGRADAARAWRREGRA